MKTRTTLILASGLLGLQAHAEILASWRPVAEALPGGAQYANTLTTPIAEVTVPEVLSASAFRTNQGSNPNAGAVWPGSISASNFDATSYTTFSLNVAGDAAVDFESLTYVCNTYGFEREIINPGTPEEEIIPSTLQLRIRSSIDGFQSDVASLTSLPADRPSPNGLNFTFDLSENVDLQDFSGMVDFRLYIWEESEVAGYNPFTWIDMTAAGATIEGTVTDPTELEPISRVPLVEMFPEPKPADSGLPANSTAVAPTLISLDPAIASVEASRVGHGNWGNVSPVWPGQVTSSGFDEFSYVETIITPSPGASFSISDFVIPQFNTYGFDDGGSWEAALRSSLDNFSENLSTTSGAGSYRIQFDLVSESSLRNLTAPITFRVYLWETALVDGTPFDPSMWFDIVGNATGTAAGIQILGEAQVASASPPSVASAFYNDSADFQVEAVNLTPGRTYDLALAFDLAGPFFPLEIEQTATGTTLTFIDAFANLVGDPKAFYRIEEVTTN